MEEKTPKMEGAPAWIGVDMGEIPSGSALFWMSENGLKYTTGEVTADGYVKLIEMYEPYPRLDGYPDLPPIAHAPEPVQLFQNRHERRKNRKRSFVGTAYNGR